MAELYQASAAQQIASDYLRTFARLLDPNLPPRTIYSSEEGETERWPIGQTFAFATVSSLSLWALLAAIFYYFA